MNEWLIESLYYKAGYEKKKWPWQKGYWAWKIAQHARGGHSHEELLIKWAVIDALLQRADVGAIGYDPVLNAVWINKKDICFSSSERDGGCRFKLADDILKYPNKWDRLPCVDSLEAAVCVLRFCIEQNGKKYDWPGVSGFKLSFISEDPQKWYCSEVCDTAKAKAGQFPILYQYHPSESYRIQRFITEYTALIKFNDNLDWYGNVEKAKLARDAIRFILMKRPQQLSQSGRHINYELLTEEKKKIEAYLEQVNDKQ